MSGCPNGCGVGCRRPEGAARTEGALSRPTPGKVLESDDADAVLDEVILGTWFSPDRSITQILGVYCDTVRPLSIASVTGSRCKLPAGDFIVEQQAYLKTDNDRISWLRILCSGFVGDE